MQTDVDMDTNMDVDIGASLYIYEPSGLERSVDQQVFLASKVTAPGHQSPSQRL